MVGLHTPDAEMARLASKALLYSIDRIRIDPPPLGAPRPYEELLEAVGQTITKDGITGAEASANSLQPWNFTPIGLAANAAAYAGGVNAKTPALVVENKITDSQSNQLLGEGLITVEGESFRTASGSVESFVDMAKKVVVAAMKLSAQQ